MPGGRPRATEPYVKWIVSVPASIAAEIEMLHFNVVHGKPQYGKRSEIIVELLKQYLREQKGTVS